jgi:hypothetical protein
MIERALLEEYGSLEIGYGDSGIDWDWEFEISRSVAYGSNDKCSLEAQSICDLSELGLLDVKHVSVFVLYNICIWYIHIWLNV